MLAGRVQETAKWYKVVSLFTTATTTRLLTSALAAVEFSRGTYYSACTGKSTIAT